MGGINNSTGLKTALTRPVHSFSAALRFLTIFPGLTPAKDDPEYFSGAAYYITIVGLVCGAVIGGIAHLLAQNGPLMLVAVAAAVSLSLVSGFLHLDGLADTADGFMSCRDRERSLEIMKDSRIGVMGATALVVVLLFKTAALVSLPADSLAAMLVAAPVAGRTGIILMMSYLPYARSEGGLGTLFFENGSAHRVSIMSVILMVVILAVMVPQKAVMLLVVFGITLFLFRLLCMKRIGGYTGDTLGAACELVETAVLVGGTFILY